MFEISSHKVSSILSIHKLKFGLFLQKVGGQFSTIRRPRELIFWGVVANLGSNVTPHYQLLGSLHVIEMFKKLAAENRGENSAYNDPTNL